MKSEFLIDNKAIAFFKFVSYDLFYFKFQQYWLIR